MTPIPTIAISCGDPLGIGPEVVVTALARARSEGWTAGPGARARFVLWGCEGPVRAAARLAKVDPFWTVVDQRSLPDRLREDPEVVLVHDASAQDAIDPFLDRPGPCAPAGEASFAWVESCIGLARAGVAQAIVTAPISKEAWALAGHSRFSGHTELLSERFGSPPTRMMFVAPELMVILVTTHIPLARVAETITRERIAETIAMGHAACVAMGVERPRIGVCGVNPHAGEGGLIGEEDDRVIRPAIEDARGRGIDASGPFPGDTIFRDALARKFDLIVAMYHDQGLIPVKLIAFDRAVNATIGLPVPRTSPDHGTAFGIAGTGVADAGSMFAAIDLAIELAESGLSS